MTATALLLAGALVASGGTGTPALELVTGSTGSAQVAVPYPGHDSAFDVTARAAAGAGPSDLVLVLAAGDGPLADGPDALHLTLADTTGAVLAEGTAAELRGRAIALGALGAEPVTVHGTAALPATADDAVQGAGLALTFRLVAEQDTPTRSQVLATTGTHALVVAGAAAALLLTGLLLLAARRRTKEDS